MILPVTIIAVVVILKLGFEIVLDCLNIQRAKNRAEEVPKALEGIVDAETYTRSIDYTVAKGRLSIWSSIFDGAVLAIILGSGILPRAYERLSQILGYNIWAQSTVFFITLTVLSLASLPIDWVSTFKIEERFGFNKSSLSLWLIDKVKAALIGAVIGIPMVALLIAIVNWMGPLWWLVGFVVFFVFQVVMIVIFPMFIMPLFNKLEPLEDGSLKERLFALADRSGFAARTILVIDGSKRSSHSNAFFAGFGKMRRIVLYDTLIEQMDTEELEAILAHEIGHYKLGHIPKMIAMSAITTFGMFALLGYLLQAGWLTSAFGFDGNVAGNIVPVLLLVSLVAGYFTFWISPLSAILSRKHEYEADAFAAAAVGTPDTLSSALRRLHKKNLSNLQPHPLYSAFYYSHPTLAEREAALFKRSA